MLRSEKMLLFVQLEVTYTTVAKLGKLGAAEFTDVSFEEHISFQAALKVLQSFNKTTKINCCSANYKKIKYLLLGI